MGRGARAEQQDLAERGKERDLWVCGLRLWMEPGEYGVWMMRVCVE